MADQTIHHRSAKAVPRLVEHRAGQAGCDRRHPGVEMVWRAGPVVRSEAGDLDVGAGVQGACQTDCGDGGPPGDPMPALLEKVGDPDRARSRTCSRTCN